MRQELLSIVQECTVNPTLYDSKHYLPLHSLDETDERIIVGFLDAVHERNPYIQKYVDMGYKQFGHRETEPLKKLKADDTAEALSAIYKVAYLLKKNEQPEGETLETMVDRWQLGMQRFKDLHIKFSEAVVSYAKVIADENNMSVVDVVTNQDTHDEVYRRIFPSRNDFMAFWESFSNYGRAGYDPVYEILDWMDGMIGKIEKWPFVGGMAGYGMRKAMLGVYKLLPPRDIIEAFAADDDLFDITEANRVYGNN